MLNMSFDHCVYSAEKTDTNDLRLNLFTKKVEALERGLINGDRGTFDSFENGQGLTHPSSVISLGFSGS